jgi:hypothetical protein
MPVNSARDTTADNSQTIQIHDFDPQDAAGDGSTEPDTDPKISTQMGAERSISNISNAPNEGDRSGSSSQLGVSTRSGRQDGLLHIPSEGGAARRPLETSVWDWDTPLESVGESSSYYYEPQGELLQEHQRQQRPGRNEFSIPHSVASSSSNWPFPSASEPFAVPKRPQGIPPSIAGNKRKSPSDREAPGIGRYPDSKRTSRVSMAESADDPGSSSDARQPSQNTRSHGGTLTRPRSATEGSQAHTAESARPEGGGQQRTLENPAMPMVLPPRKVFPIQIGDKLFRLSGASISSDGKP